MSRKPNPTQARLNELLEYDKDTGIITRKICNPYDRRCKPGDEAGYICNTHEYIKIRVDTEQYYAHILAYIMVEGNFPEGMEIDHINGIRMDNKWNNLRLVTRSQNMINRPIFKNNSSGCPGVDYHEASGKWQCRVQKEGKRIGKLYDTQQEAIKAYEEISAILHGEFRRNK